MFGWPEEEVQNRHRDFDSGSDLGLALVEAGERKIISWISTLVTLFQPFHLHHHCPLITLNQLPPVQHEHDQTLMITLSHFISRKNISLLST